MNNEFPTKSRLHVGIGVRDVDASRAFYETLFNVPPSKVKDGYAKFEPAEPNVNLSLNEVDQVSQGDSARHFGIQFKSAKAVQDEKARLEKAGLTGRTEEGVTCCYAEADKFWVQDPDGNDWEIYTVLADADVHSAPEKKQKQEPETAERDCCAPTCCA